MTPFQNFFKRKKPMNHTEMLRVRITPEMRTDLELIAYHKGFGFSELVRKYLQKMIDEEGVPLPFQERSEESAGGEQDFS